MNEQYNVVVSKHCKERAFQRLRLLLRPSELADIHIFILQEFSRAYRDIHLEQVTFYRNQLKGSVVFNTKLIRFYTIIKGDTVIIRTLIKNRDEWRY